MLARATVRVLRRVPPERRVMWAARLLWVSVAGAVVSTVFFAHSGFERVVMAISWLAITVTMVDVVLTADVRANES